jgi:hypothetical protein
MMIRGCLISICLAALVPAAWAEVLVLQGDRYIAGVEIVRNDQGRIIYRKDQKIYQIDSQEIVKVERSLPPHGWPYPESKWVAAQDQSAPQETPPEEISAQESAPEEIPPADEPIRPRPHGTGIAGKFSGVIHYEEGDMSEVAEAPQPNPDKRLKKTSVTIGFLQGGGSIVGVDLETLLGESNLAAQFGAGAFGFDVGLNFHFKPTVHSSFIALGFWNQGLFESYVRYLALTFGGRAFGVLNTQIGVGFPLDVSPGMRSYLSENYGQMPSAILVYSLGVYF